MTKEAIVLEFATSLEAEAKELLGENSKKFAEELQAILNEILITSELELAEYFWDKVDKYLTPIKRSFQLKQFDEEKFEEKIRDTLKQLNLGIVNAAVVEDVICEQVQAARTSIERFGYARVGDDLFKELISQSSRANDLFQEQFSVKAQIQTLFDCLGVKKIDALRNKIELIMEEALRKALEENLITEEPAESKDLQDHPMLNKMRRLKKIKADIFAVIEKEAYKRAEVAAFFSEITNRPLLASLGQNPNYYLALNYKLENAIKARLVNRFGVFVIESIERMRHQYPEDVEFVHELLYPCLEKGNSEISFAMTSVMGIFVTEALRKDFTPLHDKVKKLVQAFPSDKEKLSNPDFLQELQNQICDLFLKEKKLASVENLPYDDSVLLSELKRYGIYCLGLKIVNDIKNASPAADSVLQQLQTLQSTIDRDFAEAKGYVKESIEKVKTILANTIDNFKTTPQSKDDHLRVFFKEIQSAFRQLHDNLAQASIFANNSMRDNSSALLKKFSTLIVNSIKEIAESASELMQKPGLTK